jgi:hypothetical protein
MPDTTPIGRLFSPRLATSPDIANVSGEYFFDQDASSRHLPLGRPLPKAGLAGLTEPVELHAVSFDQPA